MKKIKDENKLSKKIKQIPQKREPEIEKGCRPRLIDTLRCV